jgi:hypothetical protein
LLFAIAFRRRPTYRHPISRISVAALLFVTVMIRVGLSRDVRQASKGFVKAYA